MQSTFAHLECHPGQTHEKYLLNITSVTLLKASTQLRLNELLPQTIEKSFSMNHSSEGDGIQTLNKTDSKLYPTPFINLLLMNSPLLYTSALT